MGKLKIAIDPTFSATVMLPRPGRDPVAAGFTFKTMLRDELQKFVEGGAEREDAETLNLILAGWDFEDEFGPAAIETLLQTFIGCGKPIVEVFLNEHTKARLGN